MGQSFFIFKMQLIHYYVAMESTVRHYRFHNNEMTQAKLAEAAGVSRQTIIAIEKGVFNPSVRLALKLARILNKRVDELFMLDSRD